MSARDDKIESIVEHCVPFAGQKYFRDQLRSSLEPVGSMTIDYIHAMVHSPQSKYINFAFLVKLLAENGDKIVRETLFFLPLLNTTHERKNPLVKTIRGLHESAFFRTHRRLTKLTGNDLQTAIAFIDITTTIYLKDKDSSVLSSSVNNAIQIISAELEELIIGYPDKAPAMMEYITERDDWNPAGLRNMVQHSTALTRGVL